MDKFESLSHTAWDCKYHVVFIPKCRRRTLYAQQMVIREYIKNQEKEDERLDQLGLWR